MKKTGLVCREEGGHEQPLAHPPALQYPQDCPPAFLHQFCLSNKSNIPHVFNIKCVLSIAMNIYMKTIIPFLNGLLKPNGTNDLDDFPTCI
jgi:hypothetical protein